MKKLSRKERERLARRELIVDVAEEVFSEHGYVNATMEQIAEKAELGKGTLYLHFKSKSALYLAICERGSGKLNRLMADVLAEDMPGIDMIGKIGMVYLDFIKANPVYFHAFNYYENILNEEKYAKSELAQKCEENAAVSMNLIVRALQAGMQDGSITKDVDPKELALILWSAAKGVLHMAFMKQNKHHMQILDEVNFSLESLVGNFMMLISDGMSTSDQES
jgi:TetR/AcrR family transcriptional regulator